MNISANVIYEHLSAKFKLNRLGNLHNAPPLKAAYFYEREMPLEDGYAYLIPCGSFPAVPPKNRDFLVICPDGPPPHMWKNGKYVVFFSAEPRDFIQVFNETQRIFSHCNEWDEALSKLLNNQADIAKMLLCSAPVLGNPLAAVSERLEVLGAVDYAPEQEHKWFLNDYRDIPLDRIVRIRSVSQYVEKKKPYMHDDYGHERVYSINFIFQNKFRGSISMMETHQPFSSSSLELFRHFAEYVKKAVYYHININHSRFDPVKNILRALLDGVYIEDQQIVHALGQAAILLDTPVTWTCFALHPDDETSLSVPEYMITSLTNRLPECIALSYKDQIVLFAYLPRQDSVQTHLDKIMPILQATGFHLGVSDRFENLHDAGTAYQKACCAIESGIMTDADRLIYHFSDYAFDYMLQQAKGRFQIHDLLPAGLLKLIEHDQEADINYIHTLRCYLSNQMNANKAAQELYLHRSSLVQRMERIFRLLGTRLKAPDEQLYYQMLLRLLEI